MLGDLATIGNDPSQPPQLASLTRGVREVAAELEQVIWSLNPRHDTVGDLARHIYHHAEEFFAETPIRCRFGPMDAIPDGMKLRPEPRNAFFRASREALNNVLKHSGASTVEISVACKNNELQVSIQDDGCGFFPEQTTNSGRNGLTNMNDRMTSIGGVCSVQSNSAGTTILLRWTLPSD